MEENNTKNNLKDLPIINDISQNNQARLDKEVDDILNEFPLEVPKKKSEANEPKFNKTKKKPKIKPKKFKWRKNKSKQVESVEDLLKQVDEEPPEQSSIVKGKKSKFSVWLIIIGLLVLIGIAVGITILCDCPEQTTDINAITEATNNLVISIQNQIISQGYAEIVSEGITLKLAPYTG